MAVKKTVLACTRDVNLRSLTSNLAQEYGLEVHFIENGRGLPNYFEIGDSCIVFLYAKIQDSLVINIFDIFKNINCQYPVIILSILSDCEEKILFSIQRIALSVYAVQLNELNGRSLRDVMSQNHNQISPLTRMPDEKHD